MVSEIVANVSFIYPSLVIGGQECVVLADTCPINNGLVGDGLVGNLLVSCIMPDYSLVGGPLFGHGFSNDG